MLTFRAALKILLFLLMYVAMVFNFHERPYEMLAAAGASILVIAISGLVMKRMDGRLRGKALYAARAMYFLVVLYCLMVLAVSWFEERLVVNVFSVRRGLVYLTIAAVLGSGVLCFYLLARLTGRMELFESIFKNRGS